MQADKVLRVWDRDVLQLRQKSHLGVDGQTWQTLGLTNIEIIIFRRQCPCYRYTVRDSNKAANMYEIFGYSYGLSLNLYTLPDLAKLS